MLAALETSTRACAVALWDLSSGVLLEETFLPEDAEGAATLLPTLKDLLDRQGATVGDLEAAAVSVGPGSFTGIRVGLATVQGLALPGGLGVFGIPTLLGLAENLRRDGLAGEALSLLDAQRGECFVGRYRVEPNGVTPLGEPRILAPAALADLAVGPVWLVGPGAVKHEAALRQALGERARFAPEPLHRPSATSVASLAHRRWKAGERPALETLQPFYLRIPTPVERKLGTAPPASPPQA